ncbi:MAG: flagellar biosynthetic protein FliQ [Planctomycetota bacterium]
MEFADAVSIGREFLATCLLLVAPVVVVSLVVGLLISIGQTVTSIQEQTLSFAPRIVAVVAVVMLMMNWYLETLQTYTQDLMVQMVEFVR